MDMYRFIMSIICVITLFAEVPTVYAQGQSDMMAIIAVRTNAVQLPFGLGPAGHVGVGFQNYDGTWTIGAVENTGGSAVVVPGFDNGGWVESHKTLLEVAVIFHSLGYDGIKIIKVDDDTNPSDAEKKIKEFPTRGYNLVSNNCLSATIDVLRAFGVKKLPSQIEHAAPTDYYANIEAEEFLWDLNKKKYTNIVTNAPLEIPTSTPSEIPTSTMNAEDWYNRGNYLSVNGHYDDEALQAYDKAIQINPQSEVAVQAWGRKGKYFDDHAKYDEALQAYDKAIQIIKIVPHENHWEANIWEDKGIVLFHQGKYDEAIQAFDMAISLDNFAEYWQFKGETLKLAGRTAEAEAAFAKAKELGWF